MKLATMPAAPAAPAVPPREGPDDEAQRRAIAHAVWTDLLWLMPEGRTVTVTVLDGSVEVDLGPPGPELETAAH